MSVCLFDGKGYFGRERFLFSDGKILVTFPVQNLDRFISFSSCMGIRAMEGGLPKCGQNSPNFLENLVTFTFTREITLNDEYLSQFLPCRKVLSMTSKELFEICIKLTVSDCIRALFTYAHEVSLTSDPFWVRKLYPPIRINLGSQLYISKSWIRDTQRV